MTSRHKLEQFPFLRYREAKMCNCHYACFDKYNILHCGESKTQQKWFLDEKRDGLVDENRINNQQNEKQQKVYT